MSPKVTLYTTVALAYMDRLSNKELYLGYAVCISSSYATSLLTCSQKKEPSIPNFMQVGHCNFASFVQFTVSHTRAIAEEDIFIKGLFHGSRRNCKTNECDLQAI